jgi:hypothetical protein
VVHDELPTSLVAPTYRRCDIFDTTPGDQLHIRFGGLLAPIPEPLDRLLLHLSEHREHLGTVADHRNRWPFPGRVAAND